MSHELKSSGVFGEEQSLALLTVEKDIIATVQTVRLNIPDKTLECRIEMIPGGVVGNY